MAKKKKKYLIKLNNKIRNYFNGLPFDEGIAAVEDDKLIELIMLLELKLDSHEHDDMVRALRRAWSEEGAGTRELIVSYLTQSHKAVHTSKRTAPLDKVEKIMHILYEVEHSREEENQILDAFINVKSARITPEKIVGKLHYLRMKGRLALLEKSLEVEFNSLNEMEFYHSFIFSLKAFDFNKLLQCTTPPLPLDEMWEMSDEKILEKLKEIKEETIQTRIEEIEQFLHSINEKEHPFLSDEQIASALKRMPPESQIHHAPLPLGLIEEILHRISEKYDVFESTDHIIIEKEKFHDLFGTTLFYNTSVSYEKQLLYSLIWKGVEPPVKEDINRVNDDLLAHFRVAIDNLLDEMKEMSGKLDIEEETLHEFIVRFVEPQIRASHTLKFKEKSRRRILFHFSEYITPLLEKQ
jgi:ATP-dependent RNA helicase SUPV3L1/SUV3